MSKAGAIIILGLLAAFIPFTGFPSGIKTALAALIGLGIMALGFLVRQERIWLVRSLKGTHHTDAYTENGAPYAPTQAP